MSDLPSQRVAAAHPEAVHGAADGHDPVERVWNRIRRPLDTTAVIEALVGIPGHVARRLVSATVAGSDEASALLSAMPRLIRDLSISTASSPERLAGELRGPILWSETLAARGASAGDPSVFVCSTVARAYDTPENQLLAAALQMVVRGGRDVERVHRRGREEPALFAAARRNGDQAQRFLDHRTLIGVRRDRIGRRALARLQHDPRRRSYRPVVEMLAKAAEPIDASTVRVFCDSRTVALHDLLAATGDHLVRRGIRLPAFLVAERSLVAGPLRVRHPDHPAAQGLGGVAVGSAWLTVGAETPVPSGATVIGSRNALWTAVDRAITDQGL